MYDFSTILGLMGGEGLKPAVHGGADEAGGGLVGLLDSLLERITQLTEPGNDFQLFPGLHALGANIHPDLVHFPIAFLSVYFLFEIVGIWSKRDALHKASSILLYLGTLGAVAAAAAGLYAAHTVPHGETVHETMEWHEHVMLTVTGLALLLSIFRLASRQPMAGMAKALNLMLSAVMAGLLFIGADLGGMMVYGHGVAVSQLQQPDPHHQH